jgi:hypothetical protein
MKQLFTLGFLIVTINLSAQYLPLHLEVGTYWKVDAWNSQGGAPVTVETKSESIKDTVINGYTYYQIRTIKKGWASGLVYYPVEYYTYLRNDTINKKVYSYTNGNDSLIYNFDLNIGDTLFSTIYSNPAYLIIDTIFNTNYFGISRKVFATKGTLGNYERKLIEGLGSEFGFIAYSYSPGFENGAFTKCIKYKGTTLYGDSSISCDLPLAINNIQNSMKVKVYPNPTSNTLIVELEKSFKGNCTLELKTIYGTTLIKKETKLATETINCNNLSTGIYTLSIRQDDDIFIQKIVKE